jgi:fibronectin type 3 domain-containing protein
LKNYFFRQGNNGWYQVLIPLKDLGLENIDNENINHLEAVVFEQNESDNQNHTLFFDDIELLPETTRNSRPLKIPDLKGIEAFEKHIDLWWKAENIENIKYIRIYRSFDGETFTPIAIQRPLMNRYTDFLGEIGKKAYYRISSVDYSLHETSLSNILTA